jgi:hypothetical protein
VSFKPCAPASQAADCSSPLPHRPDMGANIGFGCEAQQVRRSANGTRYFGDTALRSGTEEVHRKVRGLLDYAPVHIGRVAQLSLRANTRPRSR